MFNEYLSDISKSLSDDEGIFLDELLCCYLLYADDLVLFSDSEYGLQYQVDMLFQYCKQWHLIVSLSKTGVMVFNKRNCRPKIYFDNQLLEVVQKFKYLGIIFDSCTKQILRKIQNYLAEQVRKAIFSSLKMFYGSIGKPTPTCMIKLFDSQILPILEYGSEIWTTPSSTDVLENVQLHYLKRMLGFKSQTPTLSIYMDTGRFPLHIRQQIRLVKYWLYILKLPSGHLLKCAYTNLLELFQAGQRNWCSVVASTLSSCNLNNYWHTQTVDDEHLFLKSLKHVKYQLYSNYITDAETTLSSLGDDKKLRTYKMFTTEFRMETYLLSIPSVTFIQCIARLRLSSHKLNNLVICY